MAATILKSVGRNGFNRSRDVKVVQELINANLTKLAPYRAVQENGKIDDHLVACIDEFQRRVVGLRTPNGRVEPSGSTLRALNSSVPMPSLVGSSKYFSHPGAGNVRLSYGEHARKLTPTAEHLLKSILASCEIKSAKLTSTRRTYHDQARITMTQTLPNKGAGTVRKWYGQKVLDACNLYKKKKDIQGFADWWEQHDKKRGRVSSKHLSNQAMDVVPIKNRLKFVKKVKQLIPVKGSGVLRIIPKGVMNEPVDHVEFTFKVCP